MKGSEGSRSVAAGVGALEVGGGRASGSVGVPVTMSASQSPRPPRAASMAVWGE